MPPRAPLFVLYVADQAAACSFWSAALAVEPTLNVPGMTQLPLPGGSELGLMPEAGIKRLLGDALPDPAAGRGVPRAELYVWVADLAEAWGRLLAAGATPVSPPAPRGWGDTVGYALDPDGHVVAFAQAPSA